MRAATKTVSVAYYFQSIKQPVPLCVKDRTEVPAVFAGAPGGGAGSPLDFTHSVLSRLQPSGGVLQLLGRVAELFFKALGKLGHIRVTHLFADLVDPQVALAHQIVGDVHAVQEQVIAEGTAGVVLEHGA